jgi:hypothetical protein
LCLHEQVRNEKAKRFLMNMRRKPGVQLENYFPRADRGAVALLKRMLVRWMEKAPVQTADPLGTHAETVAAHCLGGSV